MQTVSAEHFLLDQVPLKYRSAIPTTLKSAYKAADLLIKQEPILQVASAADNRGRIIQWAVDLAIEKLVKSGQWPFEFEWKLFAKPTGRYLQVRLSHSVLTISQVSNPKQQPRDVEFRGNSRLGNEWVFDFDELRKEKEVQGLPHFLLIHGHQELTFSHLAVPNALHNKGYIYRTQNILNMPHVIADDTPPVEQTEFEAAMVLKEEIERWQQDNGG
jgi:hypothetical protein